MSSVLEVVRMNDAGGLYLYRAGDGVSRSTDIGNFRNGDSSPLKVASGGAFPLGGLVRPCKGYTSPLIATPE